MTWRVYVREISMVILRMRAYKYIHQVNFPIVSTLRRNTEITVLELQYPIVFNTSKEVFEDLHFYARLLPTVLSGIPTTALTRVLFDFGIKYFVRQFTHLFMESEQPQTGGIWCAMGFSG